MNRTDRFQKPTNALTRANELITVGHRQQALTLLQEALTKRTLTKDKKHQTTYDAIIEKFIDLCVTRREAKRIKDGLHQYKSLCNASGAFKELASAIKHFLHTAEEKTAAAQRTYDQQVEARSKDPNLLESEPKASRIMLEVSGESVFGRLERQLVTPWHKFLWESYRSVLEILRNVPKLEHLYHETARNALRFCVTYHRKTEFRRLALMFRTYLTTLQKTLTSILAKAEHAEEESNDYEQVNLSLPETQACQLEIRFAQLTAAIELGLWKDTIPAIEDIRTLLAIKFSVPTTPEILEARNLFQRKFTLTLANLFWTTQNPTFHAYFMMKYVDLLKPEQRPPELNAQLLIAALSMPIESKNQTGTAAFDSNDQLIKDTKLAGLLGIPVPPSREALLTLLTSPEGPYNITHHVFPELADLFELLEQRFHPLQLCKSLKPKLDFISNYPELVRYIDPISQLLLIRLLQQLGQVYSQIRFAHFRSLAFFYDFYTLEVTALAAVRQRLVDIRFDQQAGLIHFNARALASDDLRGELTNLSRSLQLASNLIHPERAKARTEHRRSIFKAISASVEHEHRRKIDRALEIERRKEELHRIAVQKAQEEEERKAAEAQLAAEESSRLEKERAEQLLQQRKEAKEKKQKAWKVQRIATDVTPGLVSEVPLEESTPQSDFDERREKIRKFREEKDRIEARYKQLSVEVDHFERAKREFELPLLQSVFDAKVLKDREHTQKQREEAILKAQEEHKAALAERDRLFRMEKYRREFEATVLASQKSALENLRLREEERQAYLHQRLALAQERAQREFEERQKQELEDRRKREAKAEEERIEREKRDAERRQKEQEVRERQEESNRVAEKQRQREAEAAARQEALYAKAPSTPTNEGKWETQGRRQPVDRWTPKPDAASPSKYESPRREGDRYTPPRRQEPSRDRYEPPRDRRTGDRDRYEPPRDRDRYEPPRDRYQPRRDEPRRDEPRRDEPRRDEPRRDEPRRDEPRRDEPRRDEPRRDEPRRDEPRRDEPRRDEPRRDEPRRDRYEPPRDRYVPPRRTDDAPRDRYEPNRGGDSRPEPRRDSSSRDRYVPSRRT